MEIVKALSETFTSHLTIHRPFFFFFFLSFGLLCSFSSGLINKKSIGLTEEATKESDQLGGSVCLAETSPVQYKGRREYGKSWAKEPVLGLDLQLTLQSLQITLSLPLHSQRAMYLHIHSLFFYRKKKLNKKSIFPGFHKPFACEGRGCRRTKTTRERSKVGAKVRAGNNQNSPPCSPQPRSDTDHPSPSSVCPHTPACPSHRVTPEPSRAMAEFGINQSGHQKWETGFHAPLAPKKKNK